MTDGHTDKLISRFAYSACGHAIETTGRMNGRFSPAGNAYIKRPTGHEYGYEYSRLAQQVLANKQAFYLSIYQHHNTRHFGTGIKDRADCQKAKWAINAAWLHQALAIITSARNKIQKETKIKSLNLKPGDAG